jgi:hypothetical protein
MVDRGGMSNVRPEKFAGRANTVSDVNGKSNKAPNAQYPAYSKEGHEKKPLSREERLALRRQVNETETMYPKRAN